MPLPDPTQPADFASGPIDTDQAARHKDVGTVRHYEGLLPGQRPYAWKCPGCGAGHVGFVEQGCSACGAGKDGQVGQPEPAVDPLCRACRGAKTVGIKCKACNGTGEDPLLVGAGDPLCLDCGGAGTLTVDCRRCGGTGFDPEPQKPLAIQGIPAVIGTSEDFPLTHRSEYLGQPREPLSGMAQIMAETKPLPTLEDDPPSATPPSRKPRYFVLAMYPSGAMIVEIAESPKVRSLFVEKEI
jgi:hypothetical protein